MDKIFKLLFSAVLLLCCIMLNAQQPKGEGSQANPYQLTNYADLQWFAAQVNGGQNGICAKLTADIAANQNVLNADGNLNGTPSNTWTPIGGQNGRDYSGEFDGDGHTISGLYFNDESVNNIGLFGKTANNAYIHDLGVSDSYFCGSSWVGGICGDFGGGRIENCWNGATVTSNGNGSCAGGIAGSCWTDASIAGCYNIGKISCKGSSYGGISGVLAKNSNVDASVKDCFTLNTACGVICNDLRDNPVITNSDAKDAVAFASGEVCYQLNNGVTDGSQKWFQTLGSDLLPVLDNSHGTVFYGYDGNVLTYSNSPLDPPSIDNVAYIDANGEPQTADNVSIIMNASEQVIWSAGWYVVQGADITLAKGAVCNGAVHLILADGAKLTATGNGDNKTPGIQVSGDGNSLAIYGQAAQSGQLIAIGGNQAAGIGGQQRKSGSNITINGGVVTATGGQNGAGIGGGMLNTPPGTGGSISNKSDGFNITINGGTVTAEGGDDGAGIGGGKNGSGYDITIHGGTVTATGGQFGAGIGGGQNGNGSNIIINDGTVTANGSQSGAGIGGGYEGYGSNITLNGGTVTANGVGGGAGIGGGTSLSGTGQNGDGFNITITGGKVTANGGGPSASGIGGGMEGSGSNIIIVATLLVKADNFNNPPTTVIPNTGSDLAGSLNGKQHVTAEPIIITYGEHITVSPEFESGTNVAYGTEITFTAADRWADNYEFIGFYKESTFNTPITEGVSGYVYALTVTETPISVYAKYRQHFNVPYIDADGQERTADAVEITSGTLNSGWYVVRGSDENHGQLTCNGAVHIILADGAKLTANGWYEVPGITVSGEGNSLTIYGQTNQSGQLIAQGGYQGAGIGGGVNGSGSNITINGGTVTAKGGEYAAGIGGGLAVTSGGLGSYITINGGTVTASGGNYAAGIGGGSNASGSNITINGGMVTTNGGEKSAGIGGGSNASGSNITINGGKVTATGGVGGAGVGGGFAGSGSNITINGGTVTANAGENASCIGRGNLWHGNYGSDIFVAVELVVRADNSNPPQTVVAADRTAETDIAGDLDGKRYATVRIPQPCIVTYGDYITVSPQFASGGTVAVGTEITFTAADRFADNYEFLGFYKESTFENKITNGVSGLTYTATVLDDDISVYAKYEEFIPTPYIDANGQEQSVKTTEITNETSTLNAGWYVVTGEVSRGNITCNGAVHLILADGAKLTATGGNNQAGITVSGNGNSLTIYGQAAQSGQLIAQGGKHGAGIGGGYTHGSNITINGGIITATGGDCGAGIGGGDRGAGYNIIINRGVVTATGGNMASGIGGGFEQSGYDITINGGEVTANGGEDGAGIGGGIRGSGSNIRVAASLTVYADNTNPPTIEILHTDDDIAPYIVALRYVIVNNNKTNAKEAAIAAINAAIEGVTNADIIAIANYAIDAINAATSVETINAIKEQALAAIAALKSAYASGLGEMGVPCEDCPAVEVTKGTTTIRLYSPEKVEFRKME